MKFRDDEYKKKEDIKQQKAEEKRLEEEEAERRLESLREQVYTVELTCILSITSQNSMNLTNLPYSPLP